MPKIIKRIFSLGSIGAAFLTPALAMSCNQEEEQTKIKELFGKITPEINELAVHYVMNKSRFANSRPLIQQQQVYEEGLRIKSWQSLLKFLKYRAYYKNDKLKIFSKETSKNWVFKIVYDSSNFSLSKKDLKVFAIKAVKLIESKKVVRIKSVDKMPGLFLRPTKFVEHDRVKFTSGWGVSKNDTGSATWTTKLNNLNIREFYSNYVYEVYGERINEPMMVIRGLVVNPIYEIEDTPINSADVDYTIKIDDEMIAQRSDVIIPLPSGSKTGQEWWKGVLSATILVTATAAVGVTGALAFSAVKALAAGLTKAILMMGTASKGTVALSLGLTSFLAAGYTAVGFAVATQSLLNDYNIMLEDLRLSSDTSIISNETIRKIMWQKTKAYSQDTILENLWSFFSEAMKNAIKKIKSSRRFSAKRFKAINDAIKEVEKFIENHKDSRNFFSLWENDKVWDYHKKILKSSLYEKNNTIRAIGIISAVSSAKDKKSKLELVDLDSFSYQSEIEIKANLFADGKASSIFMDSSEMGLSGLNVCLLGSLIYKSITYDRI